MRLVKNYFHLKSNAVYNSSDKKYETVFHFSQASFAALFAIGKKLYPMC